MQVERIEKNHVMKVNAWDVMIGKIVLINRGQIISTDIRHIYQSDENELSFITSSGTIYKISLSNEDFDKDLEFCKNLHNKMMEKEFEYLKYCDIGKRILQLF